MAFPLYFAYWPGQKVRHSPYAACGFCMDPLGELFVPEMPQQPDLLVFHDSIIPDQGQIPFLADALAAASAGCRGVVMDLEHTAVEVTAELAKQLRTLLPEDLSLVLPERYQADNAATLCSYNPIYETHSQFLERLQRCGGSAWLELVPIHLLTPLPVPQHAQLLHDPVELDEICQTRQLPQFYSEALCCHYFSFLRDQTVYLGLYDTPQTLQQRLEMAQSYCSAAIGLGFELDGMLPEPISTKVATVPF